MQVMWLLISWHLVIAVEIFRNWCIIDAGGRRPTYWWSNTLRIAASGLFWICTKPFSDISYTQWWIMIPMMIFTFWWCFDYGLVQFRNWMGNLLNKPLNLEWYRLNPKGSIADQFQCRHLSLPAWFFIKLGLAVCSIYFFVTI